MDTIHPRWGWSINCKNCGWSSLLGGIITKKQLDKIIIETKTQNHGCSNPDFDEKIRLGTTDLTGDLEQLSPEKKIIIENKLDEIVKLLEESQRKDSKFRNKATLILSKLYQDKQINENTFNKLDMFLHEWFDSNV